jgi:hypothetical protein
MHFGSAIERLSVSTPITAFQTDRTSPCRPHHFSPGRLLALVACSRLDLLKMPETMKKIFTIRIDVEVVDAKALYLRAVNRMLLDGQNAEQIGEQLGYINEPDISACVQMVFDPGNSPEGTSIVSSTCESLPHLAV